MQVIFQTGAHSTEHERLLKCLLSNKEAFLHEGIAVPGPRRYRPLLKEALTTMDRTDPAPAARDVLLDLVLDGEQADRVLLSNPHFFGAQRDAIGDHTIYPLADRRVASLRKLFAQDQMEIFVAIRDPASFVPAVLGNADKARVSNVLRELDPRALRWSELFERIHLAAPDVPITVWCNEDAPLIWPQILREIAGLDHNASVEGGHALLATIRSADGMTRFEGYLSQHPNMSEMHRRRVIAAFLDKYAVEDAVEEEIDLPGWTEELVDDLTEIYDEDVFAIQRIPGVQFLAP